MATNAERLYERLSSLKSIQDLIGQSEDADFDCKEWHTRTDAARASIAKAACGFTNGTGGVIVIGVRAKGAGSGIPDVVNALVPVADREAVKAEVLDIILKFVEPGIEGIRVKTIPDQGAKKPSGFVLVFVPESEGSVRRSKVDWRFYVRVTSGTLPMEYFQIEERFGKRPPPRLSLVLTVESIVQYSGNIRAPMRYIAFGLKNESRSIAKFPGVRFKSRPELHRYDFGVDERGGTGLPPRASEDDWIVFRGGVDDVIYPGENRMVSKLIQTATIKEERPIPQPFYTAHPRAIRLWECASMRLEYEVSAEGAATLSGEYQLEADSLTLEYQVR